MGAGGVGVGTRHQPHSARSCELALRAVGAARGRPGGAPLAWVWGVRGWALSHARPPVLGACGRGPLPTGCGCNRAIHNVLPGRYFMDINHASFCAITPVRTQPATHENASPPNLRPLGYRVAWGTGAVARDTGAEAWGTGAVVTPLVQRLRPQHCALEVSGSVL